MNIQILNKKAIFPKFLVTRIGRLQLLISQPLKSKSSLSEDEKKKQD
jgi:hypothetical protein